MTVAITRTELSAAELRAEAGRTKDARVVRRLLALALVLDGHSREQAAESCGMDRQSLRDWVHRYNVDGVAGLANKPNTGAPPRKLTSEQEAEVAAWVRQGPEVERHGVVRWRRADLRDEIARHFRVVLHERSVGKLLHRLGFRHVSVRPRHPQADAQAQSAHKKTLPNWSRPSSPTMPAANRSSCGGKTRRGSASRAA